MNGIEIYFCCKKANRMSDLESAKNGIEQIRKELEQLSQKIEYIAKASSLGTEATSIESMKIEDLSEERVAELFSSLAHVERVKILKTLYGGGKYFTELMNKTGLSHSPLYFHLTVLQKGRYVIQEFTRGRYLITPLGSEALKVASHLCKIIKKEE
jgi:DNA-binding transcriptional ArsR family regulator